MDAPLHYLADGAGIETLPISAVVGRARVIEILDREAIRTSELEAHHFAKGERVLFKTVNSARCWDTNEFQTNYVAIEPAAARYLAHCKIQTVGVDYLSVGPFQSGGPETHRALIEAGIWIIEGLQLRDVEPGEYELICLPLKILGGDGAPARAVLRKLVL
jgi:arylformamidase